MSPSRKPSIPPKRTAPHVVRIVGGRFKRTPIPVVDAPGLRPTPDRVRETVFNWLNHLWDGDFSGRKVLDPFAGTGAMGLEAASRGADSVVMIDNNRKACVSLQALCDRLHAHHVHVIAGDALRTLATLSPVRFDLVLLDPPYGQGWLEKALPLAMQVLTDDGIVYIEDEKPVETPPSLELLRQDQAGAVHFHLFRHVATPRQPPETPDTDSFQFAALQK